MNEPYMDVEQLTKYLNVSNGLIYKLVKSNQIPHRKIGSKIIFNNAEINDWLEQQKTK